LDLSKVNPDMMTSGCYIIMPGSFLKTPIPQQRGRKNEGKR
jgi:hypothetical protein